MSNEKQSVKMWSGRFREPLDSDFEKWQRSIVFDWRLLPSGSRRQQGPRIRPHRREGILTAR
jgi:argininosuccinate lyase